MRPHLLQTQPASEPAVFAPTVFALTVLALGALGSGCGLGYQSALGFRARKAVLAENFEAFPALMEEAASSTPKGPNDNPKKTVLTHFLDLAADPRFFPTIEDWRARGWVGDDMTCSIYRAHARLNWTKDRAAAEKSVEQCLDVARRASVDPDKGWQVADCLEDASFLVQTSTVALAPYLARVADVAEPVKFRVALLDGMTRIPLHGPERQRAEDGTLSREDALARAMREMRAAQSRFEAILAATRPFLESTLLAAGTARGAMEIEEVSLSLGESLVGRYALSSKPDDADLAWAWVRVMKARKKVPTLSALALWDRQKETREDVFWYACTRPAPPVTGALGTFPAVDAMMLRAFSRADDGDALRRAECVEKLGSDPYPVITGPFPLESVARGSIAQQVARSAAQSRAVVNLKRRVFVGPPQPPRRAEDATPASPETPSPTTPPS